MAFGCRRLGRDNDARGGPVELTADGDADAAERGENACALRRRQLLEPADVVARDYDQPDEAGGAQDHDVFVDGLGVVGGIAVGRVPRDVVGDPLRQGAGVALPRERVHIWDQRQTTVLNQNGTAPLGS
jgi:hypothetical protein